MTNWRWKGMDTVIFAPDLIEHAFVGVSLSDTKFMGGEYSNATQFTNVCVYMHHYLTPPKKACLKLFCTWNGCNYCFLEESQQRVRGRRERIFSTRIHWFGMSEEHTIWTYCFPCHLIFNLLQEIKNFLELGVARYQLYQNFLQPFIF